MEEGDNRQVSHGMWPVEVSARKSKQTRSLSARGSSTVPKEEACSGNVRAM